MNVSHSRTAKTTITLAIVMALGINSRPQTQGDESRLARRKPGSNTVDFEKQIARLIARRCLECHSGDEPQGKLDLTRRATATKGGETGKAFVPGDLKNSLLWQRVNDGEMPPKTPLSADEQSLLKRWIASGAQWPDGSIDLFRYTTGKRAGYDWWSLQPVNRPPVPKTKDDPWCRNAIDRFVLSKLESVKLTPSEEAQRRTLIRRLSFDLLGLPPSVDETRTFIADRSPNAYEKLVDRMLASPHYGERWARHWLDIVRFGESQGFERDRLRQNSWRYRDWVVDAFNADMPYDRFARGQLAGDAIAPGNPHSIIATGFLVAGAYDEVGQNQQSAAMKAVVRQDELEDIVSSVGQTFLGLTVNCARCHDHKFDPVRQREYYRMTAALAGVRHGERNIGNSAIRRQSRVREQAIQARIDSLGVELKAMDAVVRAQILRGRRSKPTRKLAVPKPIASWDFRTGLEDQIGTLHVKPTGKSQRENDGFRFDGKTGFCDVGAVEERSVNQNARSLGEARQPHTTRRRRAQRPNARWGCI